MGLDVVVAGLDSSRGETAAIKMDPYISEKPMCMRKVSVGLRIEVRLPGILLGNAVLMHVLAIGLYCR